MQGYIRSKNKYWLFLLSRGAKRARYAKPKRKRAGSEVESLIVIVYPLVQPVEEWNVLPIFSLVLFRLSIYLFFVCRRYLTLREQKLMKRRKEAENLLEDKKKLLEWEKRLDQEEILVRNLLNEALKLESSRKIRRVSSLTSEDDEHRGDKTTRCLEREEIIMRVLSCF